MAQFLALIPMTAGNFDSESATDGQVLTADGSGGAAWEDGGGGGGASFAFDGATITVGSYATDDGYYYPVTIELTLDDTPITQNAAYFAFISLDGTYYGQSALEFGFQDVTNSSITTIYDDASSGPALFYAYYIHDAEPLIVVNKADSSPEGETVRLNIILPTGGIVVSDAMEFPVPE